MLVDHLRGERRLAADVQSLGVSVVSRCELFAGRDEPELVRRLLWPMIEMPIDAAILSTQRKSAQALRPPASGP